jgi:uncharacterized protein YabN with tetrapyrrole methylase and pyrophosphatase domain
VRACKLSSRASRQGFDWKSADEVLEKLTEELRELEKARAAKDQKAIAEEVGDLLFVIANLARRLDVDPEMALDSTNRKFVERFRYMEEQIGAQNRSLSEASTEEMEALWREAKKKS